MQKGTSQHLLNNQSTIETLGTSIQESFTNLIQQELGPMLNEINQQAKVSTEGSQAFIAQASAQQVEGVERIISTVMEGIDQAVGTNLKTASEAMSAVAAQQSATVNQWNESVTKMERLVHELHQISDDMRQGADAISVGVQPIGEAATHFLTASSKLYEVLPSIQGASEGYVQAQTGLKDTAQVLTSGTEALQQMAETQRNELAQWKQRAESMTTVLNRVEGAMNQMEDFSKRFAEASGPTQEAAQAFAEVSTAIGQAVPNLTASLEAQTQAGTAIDAAATRIQEGTKGYLEAAELITKLVTALERTHGQAVHQQQQASAVQTQQLDAWNEAIERFQPILERTQALVTQVHDASGELANFTHELRDAAEPTREAASAFSNVTQVIQQAIPTIESSVHAHGKVGDAINHAASHLEQSTTGYHQAADLVRTLVGDLDESHRKLREHRQASDQAQSAHLDSWNQALAHLGPTVTQLETVVQGLQGGIADIGPITSSLAEAAAPTAQAADSFRKVSEVMEGSIPALQANMEAQDAMRQAIDEAARQNLNMALLAIFKRPSWSKKWSAK